MAPFIVNPHGRLQEWVAEEKGYFKQVGLENYTLASHALITKNAPKKVYASAHIEDNKNGAYQTAEQERQIHLFRQSEDESMAEAKASLAKADVARATEAIITARDIASAERAKAVEMLVVEKGSAIEGLKKRHAAETEATKRVLQAESQFTAAKSLSDARKLELGIMYG